MTHWLVYFIILISCVNAVSCGGKDDFYPPYVRLPAEEEQTPEDEEAGGGHHHRVWTEAQGEGSAFSMRVQIQDRVVEFRGCLALQPEIHAEAKEQEAVVVCTDGEVEENR